MKEISSKFRFWKYQASSHLAFTSIICLLTDYDSTCSNLLPNAISNNLLHIRLHNSAFSGVCWKILFFQIPFFTLKTSEIVIFDYGIVFRTFDSIILEVSHAKIKWLMTIPPSLSKSNMAAAAMLKHVESMFSRRIMHSWA